MSTNENDTTQHLILQQLTVLDSKFESLRKDLQESFVLKAVFEVWEKAFDARLTELENSHKNRAAQVLSVVGGSLGICTAILYILHLLLPGLLR